MITCLDKFGKSIRFGKENELRPIDFIELQWDRKYLECGSFSIYIPATEYKEEIKYVQNSGRPETGIVQKVELEEKSNGDFVTLSGFFVEKALDFGSHKFAYDFAADSATPENKIRSYIDWSLGGDYMAFPYKQNIYKVTFNEKSIYPKDVDNNIEAGANAGQALYDILSGDNMSYRCNPIFGTDENYPLLGVDITVYQGRDLTDKVFFGEAFKNVSEMKFTYDESNEYPVYLVLQELPEGSSLKDWGKLGPASQTQIDGNVKTYIETYFSQTTNMPKDMGQQYPEKVYFSAVDNCDITTANYDKIIKQMQLQAQLDMLNYYKVENMEVKVIQNRFLYQKDYDLGDVCTIVFDKIKQMYTARIIEIQEVHHNNMVDIEVVLGTPQKQKWRIV